MEPGVEYSGDRSRKRAVKSIIIFLCVIAFFTFFSKTINNFFLPKVRGVDAGGGYLQYEFKVSGNVEAKKQEVVFLDSDQSRQIKKVNVKAGDNVSAGSVLVEFEPISTDSAVQELEKLKKDLDSALKDKERFKKKLADTIQNIDNSISTLEQSMLTVQNQIDAKTNAVCDPGNKDQDLSALKKDLDVLEGQMGIYKGQLKQLKDQKVQIQASGQIDFMSEADYQKNIDGIQEKINECEENINKSSAIFITAPCDGFVKSVNVKDRDVVSSSKDLLVIDRAVEGYDVKGYVSSSDAEYISAGSTVNITIGKDIVKGKIESIEDDYQVPDKKAVTASIEAVSAMPGQKAEFTVSYKSKYYDFVVDNSAMVYEDTGTYIYMVRQAGERSGMNYYIVKVPVKEIETDNLKTALDAGEKNKNDLVVLRSDRAINEGDRVVLMK